jgi:hypothetical protein
MANPTKNPHGPDQHGADDKGEHGHAGDNPQVSFERGDIDIVQITGFGIGLLIACMVTVFAMWALFEYFQGREDKVNPPNPPAMMSEKPTLPPAPRLQPEPIKELKDLRDNEDMLLNSYGWVDSAKGIAHIPIDQAIDIIAQNTAAQKGLPVKVSPAGADHDGFRTIPSDASGGRTLEKISQ